jgi:cyclase
MFRPRVIPCLLFADDGLVKTIRFKNPRYVGDPVNVISIFNKLEADEIVLLDIMASRHGRPPAFDMVARIADECTAPLSYGGGLRNLDDIRRIVDIGVEKVIINSRLAEGFDLVPQVAGIYGSQAVIVSIDAKRRLFGGYNVVTHNASRSLGTDPVSHAKRAEAEGAGEIMLTSVDRDGVMEGYDIPLIRSVCESVSIPVIACGGAGERSHLVAPIKEGGASAVAAGSLFVYQNRERGVLINFPTQDELDILFP